MLALALVIGSIKERFFMSIKSRLKEKSTWGALITASVGTVSSIFFPALSPVIMKSTIVILTAIGVITPESKD